MVTSGELNGDRDRQQKISKLFDHSLVSSPNQSKKLSLVKDDLPSHDEEKRATVKMMFQKIGIFSSVRK